MKYIKEFCVVQSEKTRAHIIYSDTVLGTTHIKE